MNYGAVAHMPDNRYCFCLEPGRFLFRLQVGRGDLRKVRLHVRDKYIPVKFIDTRSSVSMELVAIDHCHDYYEAELCIDVVCLRYFFELEAMDGTHVFYSNCRFLKEAPEDNDRMYDLPQNLREVERFETPQWAKNQVVYQIFPSRFASSQQVDEKTWYQAPIRSSAELRGDLKGITSRLEYLKELGVDVVYMTPVFHSRSSHKYDTIDYYAIDPSFGTTQDLIDLVDRAHSMGMRVMMDAVFNHSAPEFFAFRDLEENWETSPYRSWYYCDGKPCRPKDFLVKPNYKCFSYFGGMPKLNLENPETADYFIQVALYWLRTAHIDGWRLDVGDEVSHRFWQKFRSAVKAEFPETLIVGEIWHYAADFLQGDTWDSVMNYPFLNAVTDFVAKEEITASEFLNELGFLRGNLNTACYPILWNLIDSHDTPRALHQAGENKEKLKLMAAIQLLMPGMPMLYYGDEVGLTGGRDPDCRRGMLWDEGRQDQQLLRYYQKLIALRKQYPSVLEHRQQGQQSDDEKGVVLLDRGEVTLVFCGRTAGAQLPQFVGMTDLITDQPFDGVLPGYGALMLLKNMDSSE